MTIRVSPVTSASIARASASMNAISIALFTLLHILISTTPVWVSGKLTVVRETKAGNVRGKVKETQFGKVQIFYSIPYAQPPNTEELRFEKPVPVKKWSGVKDATVLPNMCVQTSFPSNYVLLHRPGFNNQSEDCLYLNVFVPRSKTTSPKAVLAFIHGGSNVDGYSMMFDYETFSAFGDVVVVSIGYRLNYLGFLSTEDGVIGGNYGLYDQLMGLKWIQTNIHLFDGDPKQVTLMGHSAGGWDVGILLVSPLAKGLFRAMICQSGSGIAATSTRKSTNLGHPKNWATRFGCLDKNTRDILKCLKKINFLNVVRDHPDKHLLNNHWYSIVYPSELLPRDPIKLYAKGRFNVDTLMLGVTKMESANWTRTMLRHDDGKKRPWYALANDLSMYRILSKNAQEQWEVLKLLEHEYTNWDHPTDFTELRKSVAMAQGDGWMDIPAARAADFFSKSNRDAHFYLFDHESLLQDDPMGAAHGADLFYLFAVPLTGHPLNRYNDEDRNVSLFMMRRWSNFVKNLKPDANTTPADQYNTVNQTYIHIHTRHGSVFATRKLHFKNRKKHFWVKLMPLFNQSAQPNVHYSYVIFFLTGMYYTI